MKTGSNLKQNFRARLPAITGREAFAVLQKPGGGGVPLRRVGADSLGAWLPAHSKPVPQALTPGGRGGSKREAFSSVKLLIFFAGQTLPAMPCSLSSRQATSQTQARLVSRLCVDWLPVVDWVKKPVYFLGKVSGWLCWNKHGFHKSRHYIYQNLIITLGRSKCMRCAIWFVSHLEQIYCLCSFLRMQKSKNC